jgi:ankyrin repeat protein
MKEASMTAPCDLIELHEAYKRGDLAAVRAMLGDPADFPNCPGPYGVGEIVLEYAIYHSPLGFIRRLLELGADPNYEDRAGFPSLIAALSCGDRADRHDIVKLLLDHGADLQQRGINDYTPLHYAAAQQDTKAIALLLARGADPEARTRIDECATPMEEAAMLGHAEAVEALKKAGGG